MTNKLKYFGVYENCFRFNELDLNEQKKILIKYKIYIEGIRTDFFDINLIDPVTANRIQNISFLGNDFTFESKNYTINIDFINEVYSEIIKRFENKNLKNIKESINTLSLRYNFIKEEKEKNLFIEEINKTAVKEYTDKLNNKIFQDFHLQKETNANFKEDVIRKHLIYDISNLSDYIFGLDNLQHFSSISTYYSFLRTTDIINFCNKHILESEIEPLDIDAISLPKSIALLNEIGFFELEKIKKLSLKNQAIIISIIQLKDINSSNIRAISGNIRVLDPNYNEDGLKYTAHKWEELSKDILNKIN